MDISIEGVNDRFAIVSSTGNGIVAAWIPVRTLYCLPYFIFQPVLSPVFVTDSLFVRIANGNYMELFISQQWQQLSYTLRTTPNVCQCNFIAGCNITASSEHMPWKNCESDRRRCGHFDKFPPRDPRCL